MGGAFFVSWPGCAKRPIAALPASLGPQRDFATLAAYARPSEPLEAKRVEQ